MATHADQKARDGKDGWLGMSLCYVEKSLFELLVVISVQ